MSDPTWKQNLLPASFRGVSFHYKTVRNSLGRNVIKKRLPGVDLPIFEDLGASDRSFPMEIFILGDNYMAARDDLIEAFNAAGSGLLVHPFRGVVTVTLEPGAEMIEDDEQGGIARFSATFTQSGTDLFIQHFDLQDPVSAVIGAIARAQAAVTAAFQAAFSVVNAIESTVNSAIGVVQSVASGIDSVRGQIASALLVVSNAESAVNDLSDSAAALVQTPANLATTMLSVPSTVLADVQNVVNSASYQASISFYTSEDSLPSEGNVIAARSQVSAVTNAIAGFLGFDSLFPPISAIDSEQLTLETNNQNALQRLTKAANIFSCSATIPTLAFESYDQAQDMTTSITGLIDDLITDDNLEDEVYGPLADLRAQLSNYLASVASGLPELQTYTPIQTIPALVLAFQLYGDPSYESDILARNTQIADPSQVPGGQPLQVLFNG